MIRTLFTRNNLSIRLFIKPVIIIILVCVFATVALAKANPNPTILPINSNAYGKSYGEWAAAWWKWAMEIPATQNPLLDPDGSFCDVGQSGHVWFLAGGFFGGTAVRECTVPNGKAIFFPIVNNFFGLLPCETWEMYEMEGLEDAREYLKESIDTATNLSCEIDGKSVEELMSYREQSPVFSFILPAEDNIFGLPSDYCDSDVELLCDPTIDEGIYLMLTPMTPGEHTIHFHACLFECAIEMDVTYTINVVGVKASSSTNSKNKLENSLGSIKAKH